MLRNNVLISIILLDHLIYKADIQLLLELIPCLTSHCRSPLNVEPLVERLWVMMTTTTDCRLRCGLAELFYTLYGRQRPTCLPIAETVKQAQKDKKKALLELALTDSFVPASVPSSVPEIKPEVQPPAAETSQTVEPMDTVEAPPRSTTVWNMELASMFVEETPGQILEDEETPIVASEEVLTNPEPVTVDLEDSVKVELDAPASTFENPPLENPSSVKEENDVDLTMISGEQTVAMEESVITETVVTETVVTETVVTDNIVTTETVYEQPVEPPELTASQDNAIPLTKSRETSQMNSPSRLSEDSASSPGPPRLSSPTPDPPEDVIVSLDNIIRNPTMPARIFSPPVPEISYKSDRSPPNLAFPSGQHSEVDDVPVEDIEEEIVINTKTKSSPEKSRSPPPIMFTPSPEPDVNVCDVDTPIKNPELAGGAVTEDTGKAGEEFLSSSAAPSSLLLQHLQTTILEPSKTFEPKKPAASWTWGLDLDKEEKPDPPRVTPATPQATPHIMPTTPQATPRILPSTPQATPRVLSSTPHILPSTTSANPPPINLKITIGGTCNFLYFLNGINNKSYTFMISNVRISNATVVYKNRLLKYV